MVHIRIKRLFFIFFSLLCVVLVFILISKIKLFNKISKHKFVEDGLSINFEGFDNQLGVDHYIVPNIVHLIYLNETFIKFYQMVNIFSIFLNHKPTKIMIHCDDCAFYGKYWDIIENTQELLNIIEFHKITLTKTIFGKMIDPNFIVYHSSDVWRLLVLMNYGGIFLDNDVYVVNSLDPYRKYEMTVSWDGDDQGVGVQVLIAHKNARLLKAHFDAYRYNYTQTEWYYNAGFVPAQILLQNRDLAHVVRLFLGTQPLIYELFVSVWEYWQSFDTIHLMINHRSYLDKNSTIKEFDEINIKTYNFTYGIMVRDILNRQGLFKT